MGFIGGEAGYKCGVWRCTCWEVLGVNWGTPVEFHRSNHGGFIETDCVHGLVCSVSVSHNSACSLSSELIWPSTALITCETSGLPSLGLWIPISWRWRILSILRSSFSPLCVIVKENWLRNLANSSNGVQTHVLYCIIAQYYLGNIWEYVTCRAPHHCPQTMCFTQTRAFTYKFQWAVKIRKLALKCYNSLTSDSIWIFPLVWVIPFIVKLFRWCHVLWCHAPLVVFNKIELFLAFL